MNEDVNFNKLIFLILLLLWSTANIYASLDGSSCAPPPLPGGAAGLGPLIPHLPTDARNRCLHHLKTGGYKAHIQSLSSFKKALLEKNLSDNKNLCEISVLHIKDSVDLASGGLDKICPDTNASIQHQKGIFGHQQIAPGVALVDFANKKLGGGAIDEGFVQEEVMLAQTNFLPLLHDISSSPYKDLDKNPMLIEAKWTHEFFGPDIYGSKSQAVFDSPAIGQDINKLYRAINPVKDVRILAMAAQEGPASYKAHGLKQMFQTALKAFNAHKNAGGSKALTGKWGCGVFGNNCRLMAVLQMMAARCASLDLDYYDDPQVLKDAQEFLQKFGHLSLDEIFKQLEKSMPGSKSPLDLRRSPSRPPIAKAAAKEVPKISHRFKLDLKHAEIRAQYAKIPSAYKEGSDILVSPHNSSGVHSPRILQPLITQGDGDCFFHSQGLKSRNNGKTFKDPYADQKRELYYQVLERFNSSSSFNKMPEEMKKALAESYMTAFPDDHDITPEKYTLAHHRKLVAHMRSLGKNYYISAADIQVLTWLSGYPTRMYQKSKGSPPGYSATIFRYNSGIAHQIQSLLDKKTLQLWDKIPDWKPSQHAQNAKKRLRAIFFNGTNHFSRVHVIKIPSAALKKIEAEAPVAEKPVPAKPKPADAKPKPAPKPVVHKPKPVVKADKNPTKVEDGVVLESYFTPDYAIAPVFSDHAPVIYEGGEIGTWNIAYQGRKGMKPDGTPYWNHKFVNLTIESDAQYLTRMKNVAGALCNIFNKDATKLKAMNLQEMGLNFKGSELARDSFNQILVTCGLKYHPSGSEFGVITRNSTPALGQMVGAPVSAQTPTAISFLPGNKVMVNVHAKMPNTAKDICQHFTQTVQFIKGKNPNAKISFTGDFNKAFSDITEKSNPGFANEPACQSFIIHTLPGEKDFHASDNANPNSHKSAGNKNVDLLFEYKI